jgi:splicing factor 1
MAWRQSGSTGSNNIPLGTRRRFGGDHSPDNDDSGYNSSKPNNGDGVYKRGRSPVRDDAAGDGSRRRKKRNRWGDATENKAAGLMGLPTAIMANMTSEQLEAYTLHLRIEEISQKLKIDDVVPADGDRYVWSLSSPQLRVLTITDLRPRRPSTTTLVAVSILESTDTENVLRTSAIS